MNVDDLIGKAQAHFEKRAPVDVEVMVGDTLAVVSFAPMLGEDWRSLVSQFPPRDGVKDDLAVGYNHDEVLRRYPHVSLTVAKKPVEVGEKWRELLAVMDAPYLQTLATALWGLNEYEHMQRLRGKVQEGKKKK